MDMKRFAILLLVPIFLLAGFQGLNAADKPQTPKTIKPTKEEVVTLVKKAVEYAKKNGKEKALKEFMNKNGEFIKGELYIYAYDFNCTVLSHGGQPELVGTNRKNIKDANGLLVIPELAKLAKKGSGWLKYLWANPVDNNKVEPKLGYVEKVDDTWWLGSGMYE
jgi:cytochrome c